MKAAEYASVASVQVYVVFDQEVARATVLRRAAGWREELVEGRDAVPALPEAGVRIALAALYA